MLEPVRRYAACRRLTAGFFLVSSDAYARLVWGSAGDAVAVLLNLTMPTLEAVDLGGTLWCVNVDGDAEINDLLSRGIAGVNSSRPFSLEPSPFIGVLLWAAARLGTSYVLENRMAKAKEAVKLTYNVFGVGYVTFTVGPENTLLFDSWRPTAGAPAVIEAILNFVTRNLAAPIQNDEPAGIATASSQAEAKAVLENLAPVPDGPPKLSAGHAAPAVAELVDSQAVSAERMASGDYTPQVESAADMDLSGFPGAPESVTVPEDDDLPFDLPEPKKVESRSEDTIASIFAAGMEEDDDIVTTAPVSKAVSTDKVAAQVTYVDEVEEEDHAPTQPTVQSDMLDGAAVGQFESPVKSTVSEDPARAGLLATDPVIPLRAQTLVRAREYVKHLSAESAGSINDGASKISQRSLEEVVAIITKLSDGKTNISLDCAKRLEFAGRRADLDAIAVLFLAVSLYNRQQAGVAK